MASIWIVALVSFGTAFAFSPLPNPSFFCSSLFQSPSSLFRSCDFKVLNGAIQRRPQHGLSELVCMSKKDQRYRLAKRPDDEDQLLLAVSEQFRRREGQAQISWYPGHIAQAEKRLHDILGSVDVVVEVRDARIPASTTHPMVDDWLRNRNAQRVVAMTKIDLAPKTALSMWRSYLEDTLDTPVAFVNGREGGKGMIDLKRCVLKAGVAINERRQKRGMMPRSVRVAVIGYPNVGKSAVLNRLAGEKKVKSENRAGVTRHLQWVRAEGFDLLDSPGIIPARLITQDVAVRLAICDDIGEASYDKIVVAAALIDEMRKVHGAMPSYSDTSCFQRRYGLGIATYSGEEYLFHLAQAKFFGLELQAAERILDDWRAGRLGPVTLEPPPAVPHHTGYYRLLGVRPNATAEDLKAAYRARARVLHPDAGGEPDEWQRVLNAYEVLSDDGKRALYDEHGLVWDSKNGGYRVLKRGEAKPTLASMTTRKGPLLLSAQRGEARVRKGMLTLPLKSTAASARQRITAYRPPPAPGPRLRPDLWPGADADEEPARGAGGGAAAA